MFIVGLADDIFTLRPITKMIAIMLLGTFCFYLGYRFYPSGPIWLSLPTIFWYAGIINATNIIDNMDGLAVGTSIITLSMIIYFSFSTQIEIYQLALTLLLACFGFFFLTFTLLKFLWVILAAY